MGVDRQLSGSHTRPGADQPPKPGEPGVLAVDRVAGSMHRTAAPCVPSLSLHATRSSVVGCKKPDDSTATTREDAAADRQGRDGRSPPRRRRRTCSTLTGTVIADQRSDVTADTQGKVINVMVERGQKVKLGQPVVQLDVRTAALSAREAQAALQSARVSKQLADDECVRTKQLLDKGAITKSEFDRQNTQCLNAVEQVAQAQARNDMMSKSVADGMVRAPFDGTVSEKDVVARRVGAARQGAVHARRRRPVEDRAVGAREVGHRRQEGSARRDHRGRRIPTRSSARRSRGSARRSVRVARSPSKRRSTRTRASSPACSPRRTSSPVSRRASCCRRRPSSIAATTITCSS